MANDRSYTLSLCGITALFICLLFCIGLLASPSFSDQNVRAQLDVFEQSYRRDLGSIGRLNEDKTNRLQEQINSNEFVSRRRIELLEDDIRRLKSEVQFLKEQQKARQP